MQQKIPLLSRTGAEFLLPFIGNCLGEYMLDGCRS